MACNALSSVVCSNCARPKQGLDLLSSGQWVEMRTPFVISWAARTVISDASILR